MTAWLVHLYTASGVVLAFLAACATIEGDHRAALAWLWLQVAVDATDGWLARRVDVAGRLPGVSGARLDDLVDYAAYVFVPALIVWRAELVPAPLAVAVASAMLVASAIGFSRLDAKTSDHFFTGFPSYWNIVVLYLLVFDWPRAFNAAVLVLLSVLVFVPWRYLYPSRTPVWPRVTNLLGAVWALLVLLLLWTLPSPPRLLVGASLVFPAYYVGLSLWLGARRRTAGDGLKSLE